MSLSSGLFALLSATVTLAFSPGMGSPATRLRRPLVSMGVAEDTSLEARYAEIAAAQPAQQAAYEAWVASGGIDAAALTAKATTLGLELDVPGGHVGGANLNLHLNLPHRACVHASW